MRQQKPNAQEVTAMVKNGSLAFTRRLFWSNKARSGCKWWLTADGFVRRLVKRSLLGPPPLSSHQAPHPPQPRSHNSGVTHLFCLTLSGMFTHDYTSWFLATLFTQRCLMKSSLVRRYNERTHCCNLTPQPHIAKHQYQNTNTRACVHMYTSPFLHRLLLWDQLPG